MRVYVTGIAGFIGSHVAGELLVRGHEVIGCDDLSSGRAEHVPAGAVWRPLDVDALAALDCDAVVHLAAIASARWPDNEEVWRVDLGVAAHALRLARRAGARFVLASSAAASIPMSSAYASAKWAAEQLAVADDATVLRYANVYGPRQRDWGDEPGVIAAWRRAVREGIPLRVDGDGSQTRDFIHVRDVARATADTVENPDVAGRRLDICTGVQTPIIEVANALDHPIVRSGRAGGDPDAVIQDPEPAATELGFRAEVCLDDYLAAA